MFFLFLSFSKNKIEKLWCSMLDRLLGVLYHCKSSRTVYSFFGFYLYKRNFIKERTDVLILR